MTKRQISYARCCAMCVLSRALGARLKGVVPIPDCEGRGRTLIGGGGIAETRVWGVALGRGGRGLSPPDRNSNDSIRGGATMAQSCQLVVG